MDSGTWEWQDDPSGLYFVRSGYRWLLNVELAPSSDPNSLEEDWRKYFIVTLWAICGSRNKLLHEGISQTVEDIILFLKMYIQEVNASSLPRPSPSIVRIDHWSPPTNDLLKANSTMVL
ncbi:hypothetical protein V6N12_069510 [Hibiscus sabdariffa]|uniref:Uncharacterized protein n=1 Tax=Hibiscus sabdariffa TaxID=183260 RepID=A0ABR2FE77_9ROSI